MKLLQVAAEFYGIAKTGGLADMVASLSSALEKSPDAPDLRVCVPGYPAALERLQHLENYGSLTVYGERFDIWQGVLTPARHPVIVLDCPRLFARAGDPYRDEHGVEFPDNGWRFACFNAAVANLCRTGVEGWLPDVVHLHDWHTGLTAAFLADDPVCTVFTVHNFSFHGVFGRELFEALSLPEFWWHPEQLEFYGGFSFMKAALHYADHITAVSPRYAEEMGTEEFGCGLEGVVAQKRRRMTGIVNGIDQHEWDPAKDSHIDSGYSSRNVTSGKRANKRAIQEATGLPVKDVPLVIFIGRLAHQKGPDLILEAKRAINELPVQLVVLGSGDKTMEHQLREWADEKPHQMAAIIDVSEPLAHQLTAAADFQLMPSRFEPCGLSQMYAQRYGTLPIARATGGLADTIVDATPETLAAGTASGFLFSEPSGAAMTNALIRALDLHRDRSQLRKMRQAAMKRDFSWANSAKAYSELYRSLTNTPATGSARAHAAERAATVTLAK